MVSPIWMYYDQVKEGDTKVARCKMCFSSYKCSGGTTSPLLNHIKAKHEQSYLEFRQKKPIVGRNKVSENDPNLSNEETIALTNGEEDLSFDPLVSENVPIKEEQSSRTDKLVLSGEDFTNDVVNIFKELAKDSDFTNVTLVADGGVNIKAHKVVLSAFSPFFRNLLVNNPHQHPLLYLRGVQSEDLLDILDFIYLGQTKVDMENINKFMDLAKDLQIKGLAPASQNEGDEHEERVKDTNLEDTDVKIKQTIDTSMVTKPHVAVQFPCHLCGYTSESRKGVMDHVTAEHANIQCYLCNYTCDKKEKLGTHMETVHKDNLFSSDSSEFVSESRKSLSFHNETEH